MNLSSLRQRVARDAVRFAPMGLYSGAVGWTARRRLPRALRRPLYGAFARAVGAALDEVELPLDSYPTFGDFFARRLVPHARPVEAGDSWVAPCDGRVLSAGSLDRVRAKGVEFTASELLASQQSADRLGDDAEQITIYLSPRDYHRVHSPCDARILGYTYVPGKQYPVRPDVAAVLGGVVALNERLVVELETSVGYAAVVMVGAGGVGNIELYRPWLETHQYRGALEPVHRTLRESVDIARGEELGAFRLGSTVVLCAPRGTLDVHGISLDQPLRVGQGLSPSAAGGQA